MANTTGSTNLSFETSEPSPAEYKNSGYQVRHLHRTKYYMRSL